MSDISPCPDCSRMLKTGSLGEALLMSSRIWSTVGGSGRLGRTTRFLALEAMFIAADPRSPSASVHTPFLLEQKYKQRNLLSKLVSAAMTDWLLV